MKSITHTSNSLISIIGAGCEGPWVICGDFNVSRFPSERTNCNRITRTMADFNQCINDLEFLDPPLSGGSYTWRRGQNHSCATRIDRFLFSSQWDESFSKISQSVQPQLGSDHNPILLSCGDWKHRKSYFKFENWWLKEEGFIDKVKEWWSSFNATGRPDSQLASKLSQLKVKLKEWSKANRNNWKERKDLILSQVGNLESIPGSQTFDR